MKSRVLLLVLATCVCIAACSSSRDRGGYADPEREQAEAAAATLPTASPTATPRPSPTPMPTSTPAPTATATPVPTVTSTPQPTPTPTITPTPTPTPAPPEPVTTSVDAVIGETVQILAAFDPDGRITRIEVPDSVPGLFAGTEGTLGWTPTTAGVAQVEITAVDDDGLTWTGELRLRATHPFRPDAMVAMGDSVPSGHGLDLEDYLELDPCWRADGAWPVRVFDSLQDVGVLDPREAELAQVSCSGYFTFHLWQREVTGGFRTSDEPDDTVKSQLDWAIEANARIVTVQIGANNTGFVGPERLFTDENELDLDQVQTRLERIRNDLTFLLRTLVDGTDSTIFVGDYYDTTADNPQGIEGCRTECFAEKSAFVVQGMNTVIAEVANSFGERVVFVPIAPLFVGHAAPNGLGPDGFREAGFGQVGELLNIQVAEIHPYCARGETTGDPWINAVDCVHPDTAGHVEIARAFSAAIVTNDVVQDAGN